MVLVRFSGVQATSDIPKAVMSYPKAVIFVDMLCCYGTSPAPSPLATTVLVLHGRSFSRRLDVKKERRNESVCTRKESMMTLPVSMTMQV